MGGGGLGAPATMATPPPPGVRIASPAPAALAAGGALGMLISLGLLRANVFKHSFADGGPLMEIDREAFEREKEAARREGKELEYDAPEYTPVQIRAEIRREMLFLLPPLALAGLCAALVLFVAPAGGGGGGLPFPHSLSRVPRSLVGLLVRGGVCAVGRGRGPPALRRPGVGGGGGGPW